MKQLSVVLAIVAATALGASASLAMPLNPDLLERLRAEGKLAEEGALDQAAFRKGVNNLGENSVYHVAPGELLLATSRQAIVILVDFSDNVADTAGYPPSHYSELLFSAGTYPTGSMRDYYLENSYGDFEVTGQVTAWLRMPQTYAYYVDGQKGFGDYPNNCQKMAEDAVLAADPYVDFSQYDNNGPDGIPNSGDDDGFVDALFVVHAGPGYEQTHDPNDIHSHAWQTSYYVPVDGVRVSRYSTEPDDGKIGVFCHEFGHVLGCPDLYDYGGDSWGVGYWSLMGHGCWGNGGITPTHLDAWDKARLGYLTLVVPTGSLIDMIVPRVEDNPVAYKLWTNGSPLREFFVVEHRQATMFDSYLPGSGIVICHVDENQVGNDNQRCGGGSPHSLMAVEQADGQCDLEYNLNSGDPGDPWPGSGGTQNPNHAFNVASTPRSRAYNGTATGVSVYHIHFEGDTAYLSMAVNLVPPIVEVVGPDGGEAFALGSQDTIRWIAFDDVAVDSLSLLLSTDSGVTYPTVLGHGEANDSSFVWNITGSTSEHCRIKVVAYDRNGNSASDTSDADFEIYDLAGVPTQVAADFRILSIRPNPTRGGAGIVFSSPSKGPSASLYDVSGRLVRTLATEPLGMDDGIYDAYWDGTDSSGRAVPPGVYFVRVCSGTRTETGKLTLSR